MSFQTFTISNLNIKHQNIKKLELEQFFFDINNDLKMKYVYKKAIHLFLTKITLSNLVN